MSQNRTFFLNGVAGANGMTPFAQKVLFQSAGAWMMDALPEAATLCPLEEKAFETEQQALCALDAALADVQAPSVLVVAAPLPEMRQADWERMMQLHEAVGCGVTLLGRHRPGHHADAILRDADHAVCGIGEGEGLQALPAAAFRTDVLRRALAGAADFADVLKKACGVGGADVFAAADIDAVTDGASAYAVQKRLMLQINMRHIAAGVQIFAPESTYIAPDAEIEAGAVILPNCLIREGCRIGAGAVIGPNSILEKAAIGAGTSVNNSQVYESSVGAEATVGPFAYIRPGCRIGDHTRIGDFVELKKAEIGNGTKVSHLTYIGDAQVGERVNFGCGTVVVNYDGYVKSRTVIGDDCFIGCNTNLVAPVTLGDRVFTAAGTTVTKDVPDGALTVARSRQTNIDGWNDRRRERMGKK